MIHNLFKFYIQTSEAPLDGLFKEDQSWAKNINKNIYTHIYNLSLNIYINTMNHFYRANPLFGFIISYMLLLFLPVFHDFQGNKQD